MLRLQLRLLTDRWRVICSVFLAVCFAVGARSADAPTLAGRVLNNVPEVPQPPTAELPADYRAAITASAKRYRELYTSSEMTDALIEARNGLALATQANRPRDEAEFLKATLYVSWLLGETEAGLDYGQRLIARAEEFNDNRLRSIGHRVIGSIYKQLRQRGPQREHTQLALTFAERANDAALRLGALNNLGNLALDEGDLAKARQIHEDVLAYREQHGQRWDAAGSLTNLADVAEKARDLPRALALHERALAMRVELDDRRGTVRSLWQVAGILRQLSRTDEALARLIDARARAEKIGGHELLSQVYGGLAAVHEARGEFAEAFAIERLLTKEREAFAGERARVHAAELSARFELTQKQQTITSLAREKLLQATELRAREAELERARWQRIGLGGALALGVIAAGAIFSRQNLKHRAAHQIHVETQAAKEAAEEADRVKTRFLGVASHDIRAPLGNIVSLAGEFRTSPAAVQSEYLDVISSEAQRVICLVEDLLTIAALETGKLELRHAPVDVAEVTHAAVNSLRWQATAKRQSIAFQPVSPGTSVITGDGTRLHQVATNLISNAIKFSPPGKTIHVAVARTADAVTLTVRDEGSGLSTSDAERLFRPFERLSTHPTAGESSHGLGLSIAHEIVRLHGGEIRVESKPGEGATFVASFPVNAVVAT